MSNLDRMKRTQAWLTNRVSGNAGVHGMIRKALALLGDK